MAALQNDLPVIDIQNEILIVRYPARKIDLRTAMNIVTLRKEYARGRDYPVMADTRKIKSATREAREYLSSAEALEGLTAGAILSDSSFSAFIANFFLKVNRPKMPTRLFTVEENAMKWLEQFKK